MKSKLLVRKTEKHEIQMLSCHRELKADENWLSAETCMTFCRCCQNCRNAI